MTGKPRPKCYVASPYGFAEGTKYWYDNVLLPMLREYVDVLDPWSVDVSHIFGVAEANRPPLWAELGHHHLQTISEQAELVVAVLDQEPPDNGTVVEVAWAAARSIPVIGYRNDVRAGGEMGVGYNLMITAAIERSGGVAVSNLAELEAEVKKRAQA